MIDGLGASAEGMPQQLGGLLGSAEIQAWRTGEQACETQKQACAMGEYIQEKLRPEPGLNNCGDHKLDWAWNWNDYQRHLQSFWPMPNNFVDSGALKRLWEADGLRYSGAAISILPVIGTYMNTSGVLFMGQHQMAELTGTSTSSVRRGAEIIRQQGFGSRDDARTPNGLPVSAWRVNERAYVPVGADGTIADPDGHFSFPARAVWGGNWSRLTRPQQLLYLAVGASVRTYDRDEKTQNLLASCVPAEVFRHIMGRTERLMLQFLSYSDLAELTGLSHSALVQAVRKLPDGDEALFTAYRTTGNGKQLFVVWDVFRPCDFVRPPDVPIPVASGEVACAIRHENPNSAEREWFELLEELEHV